MTKKQITPKFGGPKASKHVGAKPPKSEAAKAPKSTPALTAKTTVSVNPLQPPVSTEEIIPLIDVDYKIVDPVIEFNLLEVHNWCHEKFLDKDDMPIWETNLPKYVVPLTHPGQDLITLCQKYYVPDQKEIVNADKEILFYITVESINEILQLQFDPKEVPLSIEALTQLYLGLDFPKRIVIF